MIPKVSIIIPVYNVQDFLSECLDSCIYQTEKNIEIICIDDKSTDNSLHILQNYKNKDKRIKIFYNEINKGLGAARNIGINNATGEYVWFIDSDDYIDLNACKIIYDIAKKNDLDIIRFNGCTFINNENKTFIESEYYSTWKINEIIKQNDIKKLPIDTEVSAVMYWTKRNFIINFKFREGVYYEDTDFSPILFSKATKLMVIIYTAYYRRLVKGSITQSKITTKHINDRFLFINFMRNYIKENKIKKSHFIYKEYLILSEIFFYEICKNFDSFKNDKKLLYLFDNEKSNQKKLNFYRKKNKFNKTINKITNTLFPFY